MSKFMEAGAPSSRQLVRQLRLGVAVILLLLAFLLRTWALGAQELAFDEVGSVFIAKKGFLEILAYVRDAVREHPPLYYFLLSAWMPLVGTSEFAVRFLSVIIGVTTVAAMYGVLRRISRQTFAFLTTCLLVISPFHIRISRDARMYGLLALWTLLSTFIFAINLDRFRSPRRFSLVESVRRSLCRSTSAPGLGHSALVMWGLFWLVTGLGVFTHYFMVLVIAAQGLFLLLSWRRYAPLLFHWAVIHVVLIATLVFWAGFSPGLSATLLSVWRRGLVSTVDGKGFLSALNGLYLGTTLRPNLLRLSLPLIITALGLVPLRSRASRCSSKQRRCRLLVGLLLAVPGVALLAIPERITGRYLTTALPASIFAMSAGLCGLSAFLRRRLSGFADSGLGVVISYFPSAVLLSLLLFVNINGYSDVYHPSGESFRAKVEYLHGHAEPEDAVLLHGPWQQLLLSYYDVGSLETYTISLRDLRVDPDRFDETLTRILAAHERVWVSYDSVEPVDPNRVVAQWLHEHAHHVLSEETLMLYVRPPARDPPLACGHVSSDIVQGTEQDSALRILLPLVIRGRSQRYDRLECVDVTFEHRLHLREVALSNLEVTPGEAVLFLSRWQTLASIPPGLSMRLELIGQDGRVWQSHRFRVGSPDVESEGWGAGETFVERRGLMIPVGTAPGDYRLRLDVLSPGGREWLPEDGRGLDIGSVRVRHSSTPQRTIETLPGRDLTAEFGGKLALVGYAPWGRNFTQGHPLLFDVYWQVIGSLPEDLELEMRILNEKGRLLTEKHIQGILEGLSTDLWEVGGVIRGHYAIRLPEDAAPGDYQVSLSIRGSDGSPLQVYGARTLRIGGWWRRQQPISGKEMMLFRFNVETRSRRYRAPRMGQEINAVFGATEDRRDLRLLGYDLQSTLVEPGDQVDLTLYWKTMRSMDRIYAVFNHLVAPDGTMLAQQDAWPAVEGSYTDQWVPGEIVEDHYAIQIPINAPPGEYVWRVGVYDAETKEPLFLEVDDLRVPNRYIELTDITVSR